MNRSAVRRLTTVCAVAAVVASGALLGAPAQAAQAGDHARTPLSDMQLSALTTGLGSTRAVFDGAAARRAGASERLVAEFAAGYYAAGGDVEHATPDRRQLELVRSAAVRAACRGKNSFDVTGVQANLYINSCKSDEVRNGLLAGVSTATLIAGMTALTGGGAAAATVAAAGLGLGRPSSQRGTRARACSSGSTPSRSVSAASDSCFEKGAVMKPLQVIAVAVNSMLLGAGSALLAYAQTYGEGARRWEDLMHLGSGFCLAAAVIGISGVLGLRVSQRRSRREG